MKTIYKTIKGLKKECQDLNVIEFQTQKEYITGPLGVYISMSLREMFVIAFSHALM